jgi:hypothetical protein
VNNHVHTVINRFLGGGQLLSEPQEESGPSHLNREHPRQRKKVDEEGDTLSIMKTVFHSETLSMNRRRALH